MAAFADQLEDAGSEQERKHAFYGIWCGASKDEAVAKNIADSIREKGFSAEVVITTDWSNLNKEKSQLENKLDDYIAKPYNLNTVVDTLNKYIQK